MNRTANLFVMLVFIIIFAGVVSAANLDITSVEINNRKVYDASAHTNNYKFERGEKLSIDVCTKAIENVNDAQVDVNIYGYRYAVREQDKVSDTTNSFDLDKGDTDCHTLNLEVPTRMDMDYYKLRITASDRDGISVNKDIELHIKGVDPSSAVQIKDFTFNPDEIIAGRAFTSLVKVRNIGSDDLNDLKITVSVPDLDLKVSEFMDQLDADDSKTFEELLLRIPDCTKAGKYDVEIKVEFDEYEETSAAGIMTVKQGDACGAAPIDSSSPNTQDRTSISIPGSQEVAVGASIVFPIMIKNDASVAKTYTLTTSGVSGWSTSRIDPSSVVVVPSGQSKTTYLYVSALQSAEAGDKIVTLTIDSGTESKQVPLNVKVTRQTSSSSTDWGTFRKALEIGLVVLVIVLVIIGLLIGFNKLKDNKGEPEPYY